MDEGDVFHEDLGADDGFSGYYSAGHPHYGDGASGDNDDGQYYSSNHSHSYTDGLNASAAAAARAQAQAEAEAEADAYSNAELARDMELDLVQDYLVYVKWNGTLSLSKANHEVPVRVQATTSLEELKRRSLAKFNHPQARTTALEYIVFYFKGRRLLDDALTMEEVGVKENDTLVIHWH